MKCDPIQSNLILLDPIWFDLIQFDRKTHKGPLNAGKDEVVPVGEVEEQSLLLSSASASIINNQVHSWSFFIKTTTLFSLLVLHMWCFNEFFCAALTLFNVLWSLTEAVVCAVVLRCWEKLWKNRSCLLKNERNNVTQPQYNATRATLSLGWLLRYKKFKSSQTESTEKE